MTGGMDTRSKSKATGSNNDAPSEETEARAPELTTREYELRETERAIRDKENRLRIQENSLRQRFEDLEYQREKLEREREVFSRNAAKKENELSAREKDIDRKWNESSENTQFNNMPLKITETCNMGYEEALPRTNANAWSGVFDNMGLPTPKVSFREATESVPYFDGYNIPLSQFTRACRRAREIIPPSAERNLTKLLINKLGQRAYYAVEDEPCDSVTELIDLLTGAFGSPKTLDEYRGELSNIYMKRNEHVLDYISRVKDIRISILDTERRNKGHMDARFTREIDDLTARSFYQGLPLEYRLQISEDVRSRYSDAFAAAKLISKRQEIDALRYNTKPEFKGEPRKYDNTRYRDNRYREIEENKIPPRTQDTRDYRRADSMRYRDTRYTDQDRRRSDIPLKTFDTRRDIEPRNKTRENDNQVKECRYCKTRGHDIEQCRKRQYNNAQNKNQGNASSPSGNRNAPPADEKSNARQMNLITIEEKKNDQLESQS